MNNLYFIGTDNKPGKGLNLVLGKKFTTAPIAIGTGENLKSAIADLKSKIPSDITIPSGIFEKTRDLHGSYVFF